MFRTRPRWLALAALPLLSEPSQADVADLRVAGVTAPNCATLANHHLVLNGAGLRRLLGMNGPTS